MVDVIVRPIIHTVVINVSGSVDGLGGVERVGASPGLMTPPVVVVSVRVVMRTRVPMDVAHYFVRRDQIPVLGYGHAADPRGPGRVPDRDPSVRHQLYWNGIHRIA